jgi:hypothetical protein
LIFSACHLRLDSATEASDVRRYTSNRPLASELRNYAAPTHATTVLGHHAVGSVKAMTVKALTVTAVTPNAMSSRPMRLHRMCRIFERGTTERDLQFAHLALAHDRDVEAIALRAALKGIVDSVNSRDPTTARGHDHTARLQPGLLRRRASHDLGDQYTRITLGTKGFLELVGHLLDPYTQHRPARLGLWKRRRQPQGFPIAHQRNGRHTGSLPDQVLQAVRRVGGQTQAARPRTPSKA